MMKLLFGLYLKMFRSDYVELRDKTWRKVAQGKVFLYFSVFFGMLNGSVLPKINQHSLNEMLNSSFLLCEVYNSNHDCDVWLCLGSCHMIQ